MYNHYNHKELARASRIGLRPMGLKFKESENENVYHKEMRKPKGL